MGGRVSNDSKSSNRIDSYLDSFKFYQIFTNSGGIPGGVWVVVGWVGAPPTNVGMHTHTHVEHDKYGCLHGGGHMQFPNIFILVFHACMYMHIHVHMSRDTPMSPDAHRPSALFPKPQGAQMTEN